MNVPRNLRFDLSDFNDQPQASAFKLVAKKENINFNPNESMIKENDYVSSLAAVQGFKTSTSAVPKHQQKAFNPDRQTVA